MGTKSSQGGITVGKIVPSNQIVKSLRILKLSHKMLNPPLSQASSNIPTSEWSSYIKQLYGGAEIMNIHNETADKAVLRDECPTRSLLQEKTS